MLKLAPKSWAEAEFSELSRKLFNEHRWLGSNTPPRQIYKQTSGFYCTVHHVLLHSPPTKIILKKRELKFMARSLLFFLLLLLLLLLLHLFSCHKTHLAISVPIIPSGGKPNRPWEMHLLGWLLLLLLPDVIEWLHESQIISCCTRPSKVQSKRFGPRGPNLHRTFMSYTHTI